MTESDNRLGEYLRARREQVRPGDVGLPELGRRRVPGLRREELALLAGISTDYYLRLEQGRDHHPSQQVLDALARALRLSEDATAELHLLGRRKPHRRRPTHRREQAPAGVRHLIESWPDHPAYVRDRYMNVLAANPLATALCPIYSRGVNLLRATFLDPAVREMYRDWEVLCTHTLGGVRKIIGPDVDDPYLNELVGELSVRSDRFRRRWAQHKTQAKPGGTIIFDHPQVGPLELWYERFDVGRTNGQALIVFHADQGTPSEQALSLLASIAEDRQQIERPQEASAPDETPR